MELVTNMALFCLLCTSPSWQSSLFLFNIALFFNMLVFQVVVSWFLCFSLVCLCFRLWRFSFHTTCLDSYLFVLTFIQKVHPLLSIPNTTWLFFTSQTQSSSLCFVYWICFLSFPTVLLFIRVGIWHHRRLCLSSFFNLPYLVASTTVDAECSHRHHDRTSSVEWTLREISGPS